MAVSSNMQKSRALPGFFIRAGVCLTVVFLTAENAQSGLGWFASMP